MSILLPAVLFVVGLAVLLGGAEALVRGAASLAVKMRVSQLTVGLTVVAFGTSAPELVVNTFASVRGSGDIVFGNIIGSNIFNTLAILGVAASIQPLTVARSTTWREIPLSLLAAVVLLVVANDTIVDGAAGSFVQRSDAILLLAFFVMFLAYVFASARAEPSLGGEKIAVDRTWVSVVLVVVGLAGLVGGGKLVVDNAVEIARQMGLSEQLIAVTIVAAGTSLPELATSAVAAVRRKADIAVGNVVGSNIFNIFFIMGVSGCIRPVAYSPSFNVDLLLLIGATLLLQVGRFVNRSKRIERWEAAMLLAAFVAYMVYVSMRPA